MLRSLLLSLALLSVHLCQAQQNLVFSYDKAGNQLKRQWEAPTQAPEQDSAQVQNGFVVYPSPSDGHFHIRIDARRAVQLTRVRVLLRDGQPVYDQAAAGLLRRPGHNGFVEIPIDLSRNPLLRAAPLAVVTLSLRNGATLSQIIAIGQPS